MHVYCTACRTLVGQITQAKLLKGWSVLCPTCRKALLEKEGKAPPDFLSRLFGRGPL